MCYLHLESFICKATIEFVCDGEQITYKILFYVNKDNDEIRGVMRNEDGRVEKVLYGCINGNRCKFVATDVKIVNNPKEPQKAEFFRLNLNKLAGIWGIIDEGIYEKGHVTITSYNQSRSDMPYEWFDEDFYRLIVLATPEKLAGSDTSIDDWFKMLSYY